MSNHKWTKIERGFYKLEGTQFAVQADGYTPCKSIGADHSYEGFIGGEWAVIEFPAGKDHTTSDGENLDWFPTMREAKADAERRVRFASNWAEAGRRV